MNRNIVVLETNAITCTRVILKVQLRIPSFSVTKSSRWLAPRCTRTTEFHTGWAVELLLVRLRVIPDLSLYLRNDQFVGHLSGDETALINTCKQRSFSIIWRQFLTFSLYIMSRSPIMIDTTTWKSFKAGFLGVPAQLRVHLNHITKQSLFKSTYNKSNNTYKALLLVMHTCVHYHSLLRTLHPLSAADTFNAHAALRSLLKFNAVSLKTAAERESRLEKPTCSSGVAVPESEVPSNCHVHSCRRWNPSDACASPSTYSRPSNA